MPPIGTTGGSKPSVTCSYDFAKQPQFPKIKKNL